MNPGEQLLQDSEAVERCKKDDRDAFHVIVDRYHNVLHGTAILMTGNRAVAEEAVQEALLSAWRGIRGFKNDRPLKPWLVRILVNEVLSGKRRGAIETVPIPEPDQPGSPSSTDNLDSFADKDLIRQAVATLQPDHRQVIVLRYFTDLTVREIAQAVGTREGTVKSRLSRAIGQLREQLEEPHTREARNG